MTVLPDIDGDKPNRQNFNRYPIGVYDIDVAEVRTAEGKLCLAVGVDRPIKFARISPSTCPPPTSPEIARLR